MSLLACVSASRDRVPGIVAGLLALCLVLVFGPVAAEGRVIELRDGSVLKGELVGAGNGHYRIRTPVLGEIELPESEVVAIRSPGIGSPSPMSALPGAPDLQAVMAGIQRQMVGDPSLAGAIMALQGDPELQAALADPAFSQLILSGNVAALGTDPRFLRLMANPAVQALIGQIGSQVGGQLGGPTLGR
jgi:hypothetical protein